MTGREVTVTLQPNQLILIISDDLASQYRVWSEPLQIMVEPGWDGSHDVLEATCRTYVCPEQHV